MTTETVESLRKQGFKVKINHYRYSRSNTRGKRHQTVLPSICFADGSDIAPKGGLCVVEITNPDGVTFVSKIRCSFQDSYIKKVGVQMGIKKALDYFESHPIDCGAD